MQKECRIKLAATSGALRLLHSAFSLLPFDNGGMPWTCATLPFQGAHCLANRPGSLDRLTFRSLRPRSPPRSRNRKYEIEDEDENDDEEDFEIGPRGRTCTCNLSVLSGTSLLIGLHAGCPRPDSHRHCARFKCAVSTLDYVGEMVPREGLGFPSLASQVPKRDASRIAIHPNLPVLSGAPLVMGPTRRNWCSRQESRLQPPRSKRGAL
jgi:hypothetical protein